MRLPLGTALVLVPFAVAFAQQSAQPPLPPLRLPTVQTPSGPRPLQPPTMPPETVVPGSPGLGSEQVVPMPQPAPTPAPAVPAPTPAAPAQATGASPATPQPGQPPVYTPLPPPPSIWLPQHVAELIGLDKVSAGTTRITLPVGKSATFGALTIAVRACDIRPPDQAADATAYLDITDSHPNGPQFHGWMILSAPFVSMLQDPSYDVRLAGCHD